MSKSNDREWRRSVAYILGEDVSVEEYETWTMDVALWLSQTGRGGSDPKARAQDIMRASLNGTKLDGSEWKRVENFILPKRIIQFCGYNVITKTGRESKRKKPQKGKEIKAVTLLNTGLLVSADTARLIEKRNAYKLILLQEFPFLDNPVYDTKVNAYCDTVIKLEIVSDKFLSAEGHDLTKLITLRDALKKDLDDFMKLLRIHPSQLKDKVDEKERGDVGSLIAKWETYGELGSLYEIVDAIQESIQIINQLESVRLDGSPQLAEWLLWHKTGCRGHQLECPDCGCEVRMHGGFSIEEMYQIVEQAHKTFGFGAKPLGEPNDSRSKSVAETVSAKVNG